jgi:hypothetical protein
MDADVGQGGKADPGLVVVPYTGGAIEPCHDPAATRRHERVSVLH